MKRLGIIDWGIGGVGIYKLIKECRPKTSVIYFSDTGATPYGKMSQRELVARLDSVIEYLKSRGMTHLVIGCNAASTAIPELADHEIPVEGMIETAVDSATRLRPKKLGLIGGRRTVLSQVYRKAFASHGIDVSQRIAQPLSGLIESGDVSSLKLRDEVERILRPLKNCSHILLACTHYPAILPLLQDCVSPEVVFIDPAHLLATRVAKWQIAAEDEPDAFLTSGDPAKMKIAAEKAFGTKIENPIKVDI